MGEVVEFCWFPNIFVCKYWKVSKTDFDVFGLLSQLRACNVSVATSGSFVDAGKSFLAQKLSGEVRGGQHSCAK